MSLERASHDQRPVVRGVLSEQVGSQSNSVRRALAILEFLKESDRRRNLSEISRRLGLPKSTTSVLLSTLENMGYVSREPEERRYSLAAKAYGFGLELLNQVDLSRRSRAILETIASTFRMTAHVAVLDGDQALFVNKVDGVRQPCCDIYPGRRTNLQCTAVGKILLAFGNEEEQRTFLARHRSIRHTSKTIVTPGRLAEEISWVRERGYALDNQEEELQVRCVAVPIFRDGQPVAALGITGTISDIRPDNTEQLAAYLKNMSSRMFAR